MTVELNYNNEITGVSASDVATLVDELDTIDGSTSSTSGTYDVAFIRYQFPEGDTESRCHIHVSLTDADDSDYPHVKDDLAETVDGLSVDFGTVDEITSELQGSME